MATIQFKTKIQTVYNHDNSIAWQYIQVPAKLTRNHCDMPAFRLHPRWGGVANSDLFLGLLKRLRKDIFGGDEIRLDKIPHNVTIDTSGFLAVVSAEV